MTHMLPRIVPITSMPNVSRTSIAASDSAMSPARGAGTKSRAEEGTEVYTNTMYGEGAGGVMKAREVNGVRICTTDIPGRSLRRLEVRCIQIKDGPPLDAALSTHIRLDVVNRWPVDAALKI